MKFRLIIELLEGITTNTYNNLRLQTNEKICYNINLHICMKMRAATAGLRTTLQTPNKQTHFKLMSIQKINVSCQQLNIIKQAGSDSEQ